MEAEGRVYWLRPSAGGWVASEHLDHAVVRQTRRYHRDEAQAVADAWVEERRAEAFDRAQLGLFGPAEVEEQTERPTVALALFQVEVEVER